MNEKTTLVNYIFYLQTKPELDAHFYALAEILGQINISLLPIELKDLKSIDKEKKHHVMVMRSDIASAIAFKEIQKTYLDSAMASGKIMVYDISSFSCIEMGAKWESKNVYRYFQLPLDIKQIAMTMAMEFFKDRNITASWPGGRRSKLPSMTNET